MLDVRPSPIAGTWYEGDAALLARLVDHHLKTGAAATLLTAEVPDPAGYGRVVREQGRPVGIVEHRDATADQRAIHEIGTSVYCFDAARFWPALAQITPDNQQHEYYLTDVIGILHRQGQPLDFVAPHGMFQAIRLMRAG